MIEYKVGMKVTPLSGYYEGLEGTIVEIVNDPYPILVEFENGKCNQYCHYHLEPGVTDQVN